MTNTPWRRAGVLATSVALAFSVAGCSTSTPEIFSRAQTSTDALPADASAVISEHTSRFVETSHGVDIYLATAGRELCLVLIAMESEPTEWASTCQPIGTPFELTLGALATVRYDLDVPDANAPDERLAERWESLGNDVYAR